MAAGTVVCGAVEVRSVLVVGCGPAGAYPAVRFLFARYRYMLRILKLLVRRKNMKSFAPVALVAHLITSNHLRGE